MKRKSFFKIIICLICAMLLVGCGGSMPAENDPNDKSENINKETEEGGADSGKDEVDAEVTEDSEKESETPVALTEAECEDEVEKLLKTDPVTPDNAELLSEMANCVTSSRIDDSGVIFSQMDNAYKERLRMRFFDLRSSQYTVFR